jgi:LppP/LprE lipoprotein
MSKLPTRRYPKRQSPTLANVRVAFAAGLLLLAAGCGGGASSSGPAPRHTLTPTPSSAIGQRPIEPSAHPPVLASPAASSAAYGSAAEAERFLSANGLTASSPEQTWRPSAALHVLHASGSEGADYQGDWYFFFAGGRLVSQQFFSHATGQSAVDDATFSVTYNVFQAGDAHCCPSGGQTAVRFHWNGSRLVTLDPLPGPIQT